MRCPGLELGEVVRTLTWVLGAELQFPARAATAQHHGDLYPVPPSCVPIVTKTATFYHTDFIYNTMIGVGRRQYLMLILSGMASRGKKLKMTSLGLLKALCTPSPHHCLSCGSTVADSTALRTRVNRRPLIAGPPEPSICLQVIISHTQ